MRSGEGNGNDLITAYGNLLVLALFKLWPRILKGGERGCPRSTWRRSLEAENKSISKSCYQLERVRYTEQEAMEREYWWPMFLRRSYERTTTSNHRSVTSKIQSHFLTKRNRKLSLISARAIHIQQPNRFPSGPAVDGRHDIQQRLSDIL